MAKGRILNKNSSKVPYGSVFIGRPSKYGNPFVIGKDGDRDTVISLYREYLLDCLDNGTFTTDEIIALYECDLVCYCKPLPCHGDVIHEIAKILKEITGE